MIMLYLLLFFYHGCTGSFNNTIFPRQGQRRTLRMRYLIFQSILLSQRSVVPILHALGKHQLVWCLALLIAVRSRNIKNHLSRITFLLLIRIDQLAFPSSIYQFTSFISTLFQYPYWRM